MTVRSGIGPRETRGRVRGLTIDNDRATLGPRFSASGPRSPSCASPTDWGRSKPLLWLAGGLLTGFLSDRSGVTPLPVPKQKKQSRHLKYTVKSKLITQHRCRLRLSDRGVGASQCCVPIRKREREGRAVREKGREQGGEVGRMGGQGHRGEKTTRLPLLLFPEGAKVRYDDESEAAAAAAAAASSKQGRRNRTKVCVWWVGSRVPCSAPARCVGGGCWVCVWPPLPPALSVNAKCRER